MIKPKHRLPLLSAATGGGPLRGRDLRLEPHAVAFDHGIGHINNLANYVPLLTTRCVLKVLAEARHFNFSYDGRYLYTCGVLKIGFG